MKKTIAIISVVVLALLVAATVILAVIPKNFYDPIKNHDQISFIRVFKGDGTCQEFYRNSVDETDKEVYDKLIELHEKSLKENILVSMFQGALSFDGSIKTEAFTSDTFNDQLATSTYIEFNYTEEQLLKYNEKTFYNGDGETVTYRKMVLEVTSSGYMEEVKAFVSESDYSTKHNVRFLAHQSELYKYIQSLDLLGTVATA